GSALMGLKRICPKVRFLGSYPQAGVVPEEMAPLRHGTSDEAFTEAAEWLARCQDGRA
ncbi:prephenate dehydratase, partial [Streptomyces sp. SID8361]